MVQWLRAFTVPSEDPSSDPVPLYGNSQLPITLPPENPLCLASALTQTQT